VFLNRGYCIVQESLVHGHVGIQEQYPIAGFRFLTGFTSGMRFGNAAVHSAGEAQVPAEPADRHPTLLFQFADHRMGGRMVIDDDNFRLAVAECQRLAKLTDKTRGVAPLAEIHDDNSYDRRGWSSAATVRIVIERD
jgi:hypothetical protein